VKGGMGSGDVESSYYTTFEEGLENAGFKITSKNWLDQYPLLKEKKIKEHLDYIQENYRQFQTYDSFRMVSFPEYDYDLELKADDPNESSNIAIYVLSRNSGEGLDRRPIKGDVMLTDTEIKDILTLNKNFKKFMLVLNVGGVVDLSPVQEVSNILLISQLGVVTGDILADIILGKANPSGKLSATWAKFDDYKFINEFGGHDDTNYVEGVYVGYRYFDSVGIKPLFPFGYGLSYTSFNISKICLENNRDTIYIKVKVKNIGNYPGKEVVQVYVSPSQENADKPYQSLVAFKKTPKIYPSGEVELQLEFRLRNVARYDEKSSSYIIDFGRYIIRVGNSSNNTEIFGFVELYEDAVTEKLKNIESEIDFEEFKPKIVLNDNLTNVQRIFLHPYDFDRKDIKYEFTYKIYNELNNMNKEELAYFCLGGFPKNNRTKDDKQKGLAGYTTRDIKNYKKYITMADGPAGLRLVRDYIEKNDSYFRLNPNPLNLTSYYYLSRVDNISLSYKKEKLDFSKYKNVTHQYATAIPIGTAIAQSFNLHLVEEYGKLIGKEMEIFNINLWLAPGMNIQRNILCGRNFEYFSEDPYLSGKMAAALTRGVQSFKNRGATIKHFAANNQEINRLNSNSKMSERTLREIYLKGFQIAIEEANPYGLMTSYNLINKKHPSENFDLLVNIVRVEWQYQGLIMTDWISSGQSEFTYSKYPPQYIYNTIKAGNNIMMPGTKLDYKILLDYIREEKITKRDLLLCASNVYATIELLNK
jgi:beta-glucosidase